MYCIDLNWLYVNTDGKKENCCWPLWGLIKSPKHYKDLAYTLEKYFEYVQFCYPSNNRLSIEKKTRSCYGSNSIKSILQHQLKIKTLKNSWTQDEIFSNNSSLVKNTLRWLENTWNCARAFWKRGLPNKFPYRMAKQRKKTSNTGKRRKQNQSNNKVPSNKRVLRKRQVSHF